MLFGATDDQIRKALVFLAVENILLEMGKPVLEKVTSDLFVKYHCYIPDCYEKPEYLKKILIDLFGNAHMEIVEKIQNRLQGFSKQKSIKQFLEVISH